MAPPVSQEVQLSALDYIKRQSPFLLILLIFIGMVAWDDHYDREATLSLMQQMREIDKDRLAAITSAIARVAEACPPQHVTAP